LKSHKVVQPPAVTEHSSNENVVAAFDDRRHDAPEPARRGTATGLHPNAHGFTLMTPVATAAITEALKKQAPPLRPALTAASPAR
jgi:hypothetical protein